MGPTESLVHVYVSLNQKGSGVMSTETREFPIFRSRRIFMSGGDLVTDEPMKRSGKKYAVRES